MATFERDGLRLHHEVLGPEGAPPVLLVHGLTGSGWAEWRRLLPLLEERYRCIVPDLRGHARSEFRADGYTLDAVADDVLALADAEGVDHPHVVGFSMGTSALLAAALRRPGWAASMVMLGPSTGAPLEEAGRDPDRYAEPPPDWPRSLRRLHAPHHGPDHWRVVYRLFCLDWARRAELGADELRAAFACPALVVQGAGEVAWKIRQVRELQDAVPHVEVHVVDGADHPVHHQRPDVVHPLVVDFLARVTAGGGGAVLLEGDRVHG